MENRECPRLRPLEAIPDRQNGRVILRDPTQLAAGFLIVGPAELSLLALLDGSSGRLEIQSDYCRQTGRLLLEHELEQLLDELDRAGYLEGAGFAAYYARMEEEYLAAPFRPLRQAEGLGAPAAELRGYLDRALADAADAASSERAGRLAGLVAPHLDYPRGLPCYAAGYHRLRSSRRPQRVVVLGTNHFGRSRSVVATGKDFQTPWGVVPTDREFLERLETDLGANLRPFELDHLREHSIELQAVWLHHVLEEGFSFAAFLCPDPAGERGTAPGDAGGADLKDFAVALGRAIREDPIPTLVVASADLSHVGRYFGDDIDLDAGFLRLVREADEAALALLDENRPEDYRRHMTRSGNATRVCSVGCLYALFTALGPQVEVERLRYHQALTPEMENCVTSASFAIYYGAKENR